MKEFWLALSSCLKDLETLNFVLELIKKKYYLSSKKIKVLIEEEEQNTIPCSIFSRCLGISESIIKYLRENLHFSNKDISIILNKSQTNIAVTYKKTKEKLPKKFSSLNFENKIPISIFETRRLTSFESVVLYLKEKENHSFHKIALILDRDDRTIWTTYTRAKTKNGYRHK